MPGTRTIHTVSSALLAAAILLLTAVGPAGAQDDVLDQAISAYQSAEFDRAIELFTALTESDAASVETKRTSYHYLGRAYTAKHMDEEARGAVASLLEFEPPRTEFDPDMEPPPLMNVYYDVRTEKDGYDIGGGGQIQTIAIIDFTNGSIGSNAADYEPLSQGLASMMINMMGGSLDLKVVERERLRWLLDELDLQSESGRVDQSTAVRMGKLIGAQSVLIGSFIVNDDDMYLGSRLVKVETGEILLGEQITGDVDDVFELVQDLSVQTARAINVTLEESDLGGADETRSLDAMISYSEGLALLDQESYQAAFNKFQEALEYDPEYARARTRAESLRPMLN
ncbi:MAG: hypothetical protein HKN17_11410 [Rhodothermales bacterium]|nr:hypothetical protein [Rhodothermales bacterium]